MEEGDRVIEKINGCLFPKKEEGEEKKVDKQKLPKSDGNGCFKQVSSRTHILISLFLCACVFCGLFDVRSFSLSLSPFFSFLNPLSRLNV